VPAGLFDKTEDLAQPESRSLADSLCRVERVEGALDHVGGHPYSGVHD
jgi:hypothetical protein